MALRSDDDNRALFRSILLDLSKSLTFLENKSERAEIYKRLEDLYYSNDETIKFRHYYSDIFSTLILIKNDSDLGDIDILATNLAEVNLKYHAVNTSPSGNLIDVSDSIRKLYDHVSLEVARISYSDAGDWKVSQGESIANVQSDVEAIKSEFKQAKDSLAEKVDTVKNSMEGMQKEYITILGIFASVVLSFTAGIAFSTSVLENMHTVSIYRIISISTIVGLVLNNVLFGLFYYIQRLVHKNGEPKLRPFLIANAVLLLILIGTVFAWFNGFVENRNKNINNTSTSNIVETIPLESTNYTEPPATQFATIP